jgi:acyl-[acyl-carrier-protein]-phospholipid O-acyltransferase/long-chain-fatty-acid--[acyl-carrier-protein] ligase
MSQPHLLKTQRFLPLFVTQFMGAFNDNLYKNAMVILITYKIAVEQSLNAQILVTIAAGLFILPFFLFSAMAGQLADKYDRAMLTRNIKLAEIVLVILGGLALMSGNIYVMLLILFGLGAQSTFFGPIKYALLPQYLKEHELISGNAFIEAGTFLAILSGTILGGVLILHPYGITLVTAGLVACALIGYFASLKMPSAQGPNPDMKMSWDIGRETLRIINYSRSHRDIFRCILGISWFWLIGATFLAQFPTYAKDVIGGDETVVTLFLTVFSVGIGIGSFLCNRLLKGHVQSTYVPLAALGITLFAVDLYFASDLVVQAEPGTLLTATQFLAYGSSLRIVFDLLLIAICGGVYIVPLYAILQSRCEKEHAARVIASNNVMNALFMVASAILIVVMLKLEFTIPQIFLTIGILNLAVAAYICSLLPDALLRSIARTLFGFLYRVEVKGLEHYKEAGDRVLIIANHTSFLDAALIAAYLPEKITFAINTYIAQNPFIKPFLKLVDAYPLDPTNPLATKSLIDAIRKNRKCMIFPEGRITITGSLMKVYEGPGMIADKAGAQILPIRLDGAQYTPFSRLRGKVRIRLFPKITLTILPPRTFEVPENFKGRKRRQMAGAKLYDLMTCMMFDSSDRSETLFSALISAKKTHGGSHRILEDVERKPITYRGLLLKSFMLGRLIERACEREQAMGLMLPNTAASVVTFFGLHAFGKTPAMINFTAGAAQVVMACRTAGLTTVISSRRFVQMGKLESLVQDMEAGGITIIYLEDMRTMVQWQDTLFGIGASILPEWFYANTGKRADASDAAVILFTSGSEGTPKGVVLSHANIQANRFQLASIVDFGPQDKVFNCLPMFHSFGLTGGTLLPLLSGISVFFYPSPLHYRIVPELVYDTNATIMFGTDTFLSGYARYAHPYDFHSLRYVFAGAEKLKESTRGVWQEKFGVRIFEGYGATETSPVISTNTPMHNRVGTVGRLAPALLHRLESVQGISDGGRLWVQGPNVMLGYYKADAPAVLQPPENGWYDTGDMVSFDEEGFITIKGRLKRFAKIGGEMVSLTSVENAVHDLWSEHTHATVTVPDAKKGEQIVLLTTRPDAERDELIRHFRVQAISELAIPKRICIVASLPLLGTGKVDYVAAREIALRYDT